MTPTPSSSSPSGASGTSSIPTRWSRKLVFQFLLPTLAALGGVLATGLPYVAVTLERHQVETLTERLLAEARVVGTALPLTTVAEGVAHLQYLVLVGLLVAALLGLVAAVALSRGMLRRIQRLVAFARDLAAGAPAPYIGPERDDDLGLLEE